ncbi:hypothetical protein ACH4TE_24710 [Streptomyces sioyaensis]|uniref:hypothetical protein n=1 Tax=Streptomyces sioyaensis TaxID=67364 RepID=UPI0037B70100
MTTESLKTWQARARLELAVRGIGKEVADAGLDEVTQHCAESGEEPEGAFGSPGEFAETVVAERGPATPDEDHASSALLLVGLMGTVSAGLLWIRTGLMLPVSWAGLCGTVFVMCALVGIPVIRFLRRDGKPRAASWGIGGVALGIVSAAAAFRGLPRHELFPVPAPALMLAGIGLIVWGWSRNGSPRPRRSGQDAGQGSRQESDQWLRDLAGLLEGRHDLVPGRARELTAEAAAHLADTGRAPQEEFGPVEDYALRLAEHESRRPPWWWRERTFLWLRPAVWVILLAINIVEGGVSWWRALTVLVLCGDLYLCTRRSGTRAQRG